MIEFGKNRPESASYIRERAASGTSENAAANSFARIQREFTEGYDKSAFEVPPVFSIGQPSIG